MSNDIPIHAGSKKSIYDSGDSHTFQRLSFTKQHQVKFFMTSYFRKIQQMNGTYYLLVSSKPNITFTQYNFAKVTD